MDRFLISALAREDSLDSLSENTNRVVEVVIQQWIELIALAPRTIR
ncbi:MAG TPA: hypothetical protein VNL69_06540 [Bacteroidota bacterium]|nr:hypothetical protein [Bacteroidota bacterium]